MGNLRAGVRRRGISISIQPIGTVAQIMSLERFSYLNTYCEQLSFSAVLRVFSKPQSQLSLDDIISTFLLQGKLLLPSMSLTGSIASPPPHAHHLLHIPARLAHSIQITAVLLCIWRQVPHF